MSTSSFDQGNEQGEIGDILLPAVTMVLDLQLLRALFPLLLFVLRERFGWTAVEVGALALVLFLTGTASGVLQSWPGPRLTLGLAAGGTGFFRLALQLWNGDATVELALAMAGSVMFVLCLPNLLGGTGRLNRRAGGPIAVGILLGLALDLALHGFWQTYDLSWQGGAGPLLTTGLLVALQLTLLAIVLRVGGRNERDVSLSLSPAWLGLGPFLFLALLVWQNLARLTVLTGWSQALTFTWMLAGQGVVVAGTIWLLRHAGASTRVLVGTGLILLVASLLPCWPAGAGAATSFLLALAGGALALIGLLRNVNAPLERQATVRGIALAHGAAMFLFVLFAFLYYSGFDISLPISNRLLPLLAAILLGSAALGVPGSPPIQLSNSQITWRPALLVAVLLLLALYRLATAGQPPTAEGRYPLRLMTYNIHNGFDTTGYLGMEALASVIEAQDAVVVALQEVSRGWVINGSLDTLAWLAQRLGMHAHFAPTSDALWGMGILSRVPIVDSGAAVLPPEDLLLKRGYQWIVIDLGEDGELTVVNTHLHHPDDGSAVRVLQARTLVDSWNGTSSIMVAGDLNARPSDPEMALIADAGMADVAVASGLTPGYTYSSAVPHKKIDYIWLSADLVATEVAIPSSTASDHLPVASTIRPAADGD